MTRLAPSSAFPSSPSRAAWRPLAPWIGALVSALAACSAGGQPPGNTPNDQSISSIDMTMSGTNDMAMPPPDFAVPEDLAGRDLAGLPDLTTPADLSTVPDLALPLDMAMPPDLVKPSDMTTLPGGSHVWVRRFGSSGFEQPAQSATDASGNVYVVGRFSGSVDFGGGVLTSAGDDDIFVVKLASDGSYVWSKRFGNNLKDEALAVTVDSSGNLFIAGTFRGAVDFGGGPRTSAGADDIFLSKYSSSGVHQWSKRFGSTNYESAVSLATDSTGSVVLAGHFYGSVDFGGGVLTSAGDKDILLAKYAADGTYKWAKRFGGLSTEYPQSVVTDSMDNIVLIGSITSATDFGGGALSSAGDTDVALAKFGSDGTHKWSKRFGAGGPDYGNGVAVDRTGNVYITGAFMYAVDFGAGPLTSTGYSDVFVGKYTASGDHEWAIRGGSGNNDDGRSLAVNSAGDIYVTGGFYGIAEFGGANVTSAGGYDIFVAKYNNSGSHQWSRALGGTDQDYVYHVTLDPSGYPILSATLQGSADYGGGVVTSAGGTDALVIKRAP